MIVTISSPGFNPATVDLVPVGSYVPPTPPPTPPAPGPTPPAPAPALPPLPPVNMGAETENLGVFALSGAQEYKQFSTSRFRNSTPQVFRAIKMIDIPASANGALELDTLSGHGASAARANVVFATSPSFSTTDGSSGSTHQFTVGTCTRDGLQHLAPGRYYLSITLQDIAALRALPFGYVVDKLIDLRFWPE